MLLNQYLYHRALVKNSMKKSRNELNEILPKTPIQSLSINLQNDLLKEHKEETKKVVVHDKKSKKLVAKELVSINEEYTEEKKENTEEKKDDFVIVDNDDPDTNDAEQLQKAENQMKGGNSNDIKKVVVSFF
jgi:hypothetical protein